MAEPTTNLRVRISADLADLKQGLGLLRGELAKVKAQGATALPNNNAFVTGLRRARAELASFVSLYLALRGAKVLAGIADEATLLRGRIRTAKGDYEAILKVANDTRSGLAATVDLYARVERSTRGQIKNQGDLLSLTTSVNQAIKLSYTGVTQGEAAVMQLGQALSSGILGGDELRSLRENAPRLAQAIADGIGVSIGELKKLGKEGKLTTDVVIKALRSQAKVLSDEYKQVPVTISDAFTQIRNSLVDYVGKQNEATGTARRFAEALQQFAKDLPKYLDPLLRVLTLLLQNLDVLAVFMITRLAGAAIPAVITAFAALRSIIITTGASAATLRGALLLLSGPVGIAIAALAAAMYLLYKRTNDAKSAAIEHNKALAENRNLAYASRDAALADAKAKRQQALDTLKVAQAVLAEKRARLQDTSGPLARGGDRGDGAAMAASNEFAHAQDRIAQAKKEYDDWGKRLVDMALQINDEVIGGTADAVSTVIDASGDAKKAVKGVVGAAELASDAIKRQLALLDQLLEDGKIKLADFYAKKQALQLADIDAQIRAAQIEAKTATTSDAQSKALTEIIKLQRERAEVGPQVARAQLKAEEDLAKQLGDVYLRLLESQGQTARVRNAELETEFKDLLVRLQAEGNTAGVAIVRQVINIEAAKAQIDQFEEEMQRITGPLGNKETAVSAQVDAGMLGSVEGEQQLADARGGALTQLTDLRQKTIDYLSTLNPASPEAAQALAFLAQLDGNIGIVTSSMETLRNQVKDSAIDAVTNLFTDLASGSKAASDALKDFVRSFVASMAQIAARALATMLVLQLLDAIWPGAGKAVAAGMSAGVHHGGGIAGQGGTIRSGLSPLLFGLAPRYHTGGIAGAAPDEVYAVLQKGEEVLTKNDPRHRNNGGRDGSRTVVKTPIVAIGDRAVADAMASTAGEDVIITHVARNWDKLRAQGNV